jgi:signal transduction histidine kinase
VQAARLHEMIQSLLDFGSLTSRTLDVARHPVRIHELVRAYHASRAPKVERSGRRLEHAPDGRPIVAVGDARRVAEILERLVDNATRFTPIGTRIVLRECLEAGEDRAWAVVEVEDDGPGIAPEHLDRIFRPFAQVDGSATRTIGGLGLGLAAARAFAEAMGGALEATSVPGRGATFRLRLPSA